MSRLNTVAKLHLFSASALLFFAFSCGSVLGHQFEFRWTETATNGSGQLQGDPTTLTWGFAPDGTSYASGGASSSLISDLDSAFGETDTGSDLTQRGWWQLFDSGYNRWGELSGLSFDYEPNDDGSLLGTSITPGFLGFRADMRIGGRFESPSDRLASNFLPGIGDMDIDTADLVGFFTDPTGNFVSGRNIITHEVGHGIGILHVESEDANFLMEPFATTAFDGPQFDDILAAHRGYGDVHEKSNGGMGNDSAANALSLGLVQQGTPVEIGTNARPRNNGLPRIVQPGQVDFVSIDGINDVDYYSFSVDNVAVVSVEMNPLGATYLESEQTGDPDTQTEYDTTLFNNLSIQMFDQNGTTQLDSANTGDIGQSESLSNVFLPGFGTYFVRVQGEVDDVQLYDLIVTVQEFDIDFNDDGNYDCVDVDALVAAIAASSTDLTFDLDGNGVINTDDLDSWLSVGAAANRLDGPYLPGDANLDGAVDISDFNLWNTNKFSSTAAWCAGDFNADGVVDVPDFNIWNTHKFSFSGPSPVPEPTGVLPSILGFFALLVTRRPRR